MASLNPPNTLHRTPEHFLTYTTPGGGDDAPGTLKSKQTPPSTHHHPHHGGDSDITSIYAHSSTIYTITGSLASHNGSLDGLTAIVNPANTKEEDFHRAQKYHTMAGEDSEEQHGHPTTTTTPTSTFCFKVGFATSPPPPWLLGMPSAMPRPAPKPSFDSEIDNRSPPYSAKQQERHRARLHQLRYRLHHHIDLTAGLKSRASGRKSRLRG
ncbi:hypothetical protein LTS10_012046 [Elasticomyces elasticus]|nr:hypothetical protein LTS10_012046 [Elasticomyces elasticus]